MMLNGAPSNSEKFGERYFGYRWVYSSKARTRVL
jgi:hypothetical protein